MKRRQKSRKAENFIDKRCKWVVPEVLTTFLDVFLRSQKVQCRDEGSKFSPQSSMSQPYKKVFHAEQKTYWNFITKECQLKWKRWNCWHKSSSCWRKTEVTIEIALSVFAFSARPRGASSVLAILNCFSVSLKEFFFGCDLFNIWWCYKWNYYAQSDSRCMRKILSFPSFWFRRSKKFPLN